MHSKYALVCLTKSLNIIAVSMLRFRLFWLKAMCIRQKRQNVYSIVCLSKRIANLTPLSLHNKEVYRKG